MDKYSEAPLKQNAADNSRSKIERRWGRGGGGGGRGHSCPSCTVWNRFLFVCTTLAFITYNVYYPSGKSVYPSRPIFSVSFVFVFVLCPSLMFRRPTPQKPQGRQIIDIITQAQYETTQTTPPHSGILFSNRRYNQPVFSFYPEELASTLCPGVDPPRLEKDWNWNDGTPHRREAVDAV